MQKLVPKNSRSWLNETARVTKDTFVDRNGNTKGKRTLVGWQWMDESPCQSAPSDAES